MPTAIEQPELIAEEKPRPNCEAQGRLAALPGWANGWRGRKKWLKQYQAQGGKCALCGEPMPLDKMTKDHVIPRSKGGSPDWENIQLACEPCNATKGDSLKAWARWALKAIERFSPNEKVSHTAGRTTKTV